MERSTYGKELSIGKAQYSPFDMITHTEDKLVLQLSDDKDTYASYPYHFTFIVIYELDKNVLKINYHVTNKDNKKMYFAVGGHPGFFVPNENGLNFTDYYLEFETKNSVKRIDLLDGAYVTGKLDVFPLEDGKRIPLRHELFDEGVVLLKDISKTVSLMSEKTDKIIKISYPDYNYLGLWHAKQTKLPYVCIEPWTSIPSRNGIIEDLEKKDDLISLEPGKESSHRWTIQITRKLKG